MPSTIAFLLAVMDVSAIVVIPILPFSHVLFLES